MTQDEPQRRSEPAGGEQPPPAPRRLVRSRDRKLGGVAGGIAEYFDLDPTIVRIVFVALLLFPAFPIGGGLLLYLILWLVMPEPGPGSEQSPAPAPRVASAGGRDTGIDGAVLLGGVLLVVGFLFLFQRLFTTWWPGWWIPQMMAFAWPMLLIVIGALIVLAALSRRS